MDQLPNDFVSGGGGGCGGGCWCKSKSVKTVRSLTPELCILKVGTPPFVVYQKSITSRSPF